MSTPSFRGVRMIRFGDFELDVRAAELRKHGLKIRLQEQPFRILVMLLEHPGEVVLRDDIRKRLWANGTIVEVSHGINAAVLRLREALGDSADNPRYVETLARRGYRFTGEVQAVYKNRPEAVQESPKPAEAAPQPAINAAGLDTGDLAGQTISHYRVLEKLGRGGMGVVYRAEDLKLGRQVALKFLPQEEAADPRALGRFGREARAASALNHPNICTIYGVEEFAGQPVIAMELLEGETLEALLARGPLPLDKALGVAVQIAEALDAAHRKGIVHRDLKPSNVLVTKSGVKVLDFGLAKMERALAGNEMAGHVTQEGVILGTLHYMSPEQVQGKEADACSDIFTFGLVLYEMVTGRRAFEGQKSAIVMAAILTLEPQPVDTSIIPAALERVLRRCLAKDPEDRWQTARDLKAALECIAIGTIAIPASNSGSLPVPVPAPKSQSVRTESEIRPLRLLRPRHRTRTGLVVASLCAGVLLVVLVPRRESAVPVDVTRLTVRAPGDAAVTRLGLSPNGQSIAFVAGGRLYIRSLDMSEPRVVEGVEGAGTPFWSPDGRSIAIAASGKLKKIDVSTGIPATLCDVNTNIAGAWGPDGTILIGQVGDGIFRVPASGGTLTPVTKLDLSRNETRHLLPQFLPGGRRFLYVAGSGKSGESVLYTASLDSSERAPIMPVQSNVMYAPSRPDSREGYLVFARDRTLMALPFDSVKLRRLGDEFPIAVPSGGPGAIGAAVSIVGFSVAGDTLAYRSRVSRNVEMKPVDSPGSRIGIIPAAPWVPGIIVVRNWMAAGRR